MKDDFYSPEELADKLDMPVRTLDYWRYVGTGPPYIKVGRRVRYRRDDVEAWLRAQRRDPRSAA